LDDLFILYVNIAVFSLKDIGLYEVPI